MKLAVVMVCVLCVRATADSDPLIDPPAPNPPRPEVTPPRRKVDLPRVPSLVVPTIDADGTYSPRALRIAGRQAIDRDVTVKGVITWVYDCVRANLAPGKTEKQVRDQIDADPTLCERPKFYVGDTAKTRPEQSLWIVDVPRIYNKLELKRIKKADRTDPNKCEPDESPKRTICPIYKVGDEVEIVGTFARQSPHAERNSDGLVVYKRMKNITRKWETPGTHVKPAPVPPSPPIPVWAGSTGSTAIPKTPVKPKIRKSVLAASTLAVSEGTRAYGSRQWETAIERFTKATSLWPQNALAWYGLSAAYAQTNRWESARDAAARAAAIEPAIAMYRLMHGRCMYETAIWKARQDHARKQNRKVEEVEVVELDLSTTNFEKPLVELHLALKLEPNLWRAHYLIGSILRHAGHRQGALEAFTKALAFDPPEPAPWIALAEMYRAWDYSDHAIQIAMQGTLAMVDASATSQLWLEVGLGYDDKRIGDQAIAAFTKSLDAKSDNHRARFARGQAYYRAGKLAEAKKDLEELVKVGTMSDDFFKQQASRMLMDIAARQTRR